MTNLPYNQKVVESTKKQKKEERKKHTLWNEINAGEPIRTTKWHHSLFSNVTKRELIRYFQKQPPHVLCKKGALKISQILQGNTYVGVSFDKVAGLQAFIFIKRDFNKGAFMWTLRNLKCFCISDIQTTNNVIYTLAENFSFNFRIYETFSYLLGFANFSSTGFVFVFAFFSHLFPTFLATFLMFRSPVASIVKRFQSLSKICTHRQFAEPEFRLYLEIQINTAPQHHW